MNGNLKTDFLAATSSFLIGMGSVLNIGGNYMEFNTSDDADEMALDADWQIVGQDFYDALRQLGVELKG
jgi:hypothetical protein